MYQVKVTPVVSPAQARLAAEAGADAVGLLVGTLEPLPGRLTPQGARSVVGGLPRGVLPVMVTYATQSAVLEALLARTGARAVEARGDFSPAALGAVRGRLGRVPLACALPLGPGSPGLARALAPHVDAFFLAVGGGPPPDWGALREAVEAAGGKPLLLGGASLRAEWVAAAGASGVDLSLDPGGGGGADPEELRRRVEWARAALGAPPGGGSPPDPSPGSPRA